MMHSVARLMCHLLVLAPLATGAAVAMAAPAPAPSPSPAQAAPSWLAQLEEAKAKASAARDAAVSARTRTAELVSARKQLNALFKTAQADGDKHRAAGRAAYATYLAALHKPPPASLPLLTLRTANTELEAQLAQTKTAIAQGEALQVNDRSVGETMEALADVKRSADRARNDASVARQKLEADASAALVQAKKDKSTASQKQASDAQADATRAKTDQQAVATATATATKEAASALSMANLGQPSAIAAQRARAATQLQDLRTRQAETEQTLKEVRLKLKSPCDIRVVDWQNATLSAVRFKNGENQDHDSFSLDSVEYSDLDGDGLLEAFIRIQHHAYGQSLGDSVVVAYSYDAECTMRSLGRSEPRYTTAQNKIAPPRLTISGEEPSGCIQVQEYILKSGLLSKISDTGCKNE